MSEEVKHKHHILPFSTGIIIFAALIFFTLVTVATGRTELGDWAVPVAMAIALVKAALVVFFFMGLKYDSNENRVIFFGSLIFCGVFFVLTASDVFFRKSMVTFEGSPFLEAANKELKFEKPWEPREEILIHAKTIYDQQCSVCHGASGDGNGPAAGGLNPKPRNFKVSEAWVNGRKPTEIYKTLKNGLNTMPAFGALPPDDLFALAHYVRSFGDPSKDQDTAADYKAANIDPSKKFGGLLESAKPKKALPIDYALERYIGQ